MEISLSSSWVFLSFFFLFIMSGCTSAIRNRWARTGIDLDDLFAVSWSLEMDIMSCHGKCHGKCHVMENVMSWKMSCHVVEMKHGA